jgi:glycosyltransferase involved in cell wall biosynthesis
LEFVFVDDGSTDSSISVLNRVIDEYPCHQEKIIIIRHAQNRGSAAARNSAIASCHGEYIMHVDSDDWIEPNAVEALVRKQQETDADIVYTSGYYKHEKELRKIYCHEWSTEKKPLLTALFQDKAAICMWSKLIRKSLYTDNGITCDERGSFYEDFQVLPRLIYHSRTIACLDQFIYHYDRSNPSSYVSTLSKSIHLQRQGVVSIQVVCDFFQDKEKIYHDLVKRFYLIYLYKMLNANFRHRNRDGYEEFLNVLNQSEKANWSVIGWDKPWKRVVDHNFQLKRLMTVFQRVRQKHLNMHHASTRLTEN